MYTKNISRRTILKYCGLLVFILVISNLARAQSTDFPIVTNVGKVTIVYDQNAPSLDSILANLLSKDIERVTSCKPHVVTDITKAKGNIIIIGSIQLPLIKKILGAQPIFSKELSGKWECFGITVVNKPLPAISKALVIAGSDTRGTAYGVFSLSEKIGVSPWYWWADVQVKQQKELVIHQREYISSPPSVQYRGIFINDEDWGLQPWAAKTFEPETGDIGPKTYAKVFELLLRLKANMIWPAMHPSTKAFFHYPGNITTAEDYQIVIGSSHAEPMLRNNVDEWEITTMGAFNYFTNKDRIYKYWEDRIKEAKNIDAIYTLGMRGVHDGQMEGLKDLKDGVPVLEDIIRDERLMLAKHINNDVTKIPQVLTPYKEVLEIYDNGLKVPDDVTLIWPDDNYGYIHRLSNEKESLRKGRGGVYYHASYWGRPHDYLWISSTHPALIREEMMKAYVTGADKLWILNVGDIKPLEYNMQVFLDMAYNAKPFEEDNYSKKHLQQWTNTVFGPKNGDSISDILWKYYGLAFERRPEFMGWSQTEPTTKTAYTSYNHFYFGDEAQKRIDQYNVLETSVKKLRTQIDTKDADAFYQLVYYPVVGASQINKKFLFRDKSYFYSRQNRMSAFDYALWSKAAYDSIVSETAYYNNQLAGGKWKHIISMKPRSLPVYLEPVIPEISIDSTHSWGVSPEGYFVKDSSFITTESGLRLPSFDNIGNQRYFIDLFLSKKVSVQWTASASAPWINLSTNSGLLTNQAGKKEKRIWVSIDWSKVDGKKVSGMISFKVGGKERDVHVWARKTTKPELNNYKGFIENNGMISIHATNFSRKVNRSLHQWKRIDGLGYTGSALQALPLSISGDVLSSVDSIQRFQSFVEYDFYSFSSARPSVTVYALPTHPINNNFGVCYAVSIDKGPIKIVDIKTFGRSGEWKQNVLRNRAERTIEMPLLNAGIHTLRIYCVDPGVIIDEIRVDLGGLKKGYTSVPETRNPN